MIINPIMTPINKQVAGWDSNSNNKETPHIPNSYVSSGSALRGGEDLNILISQIGQKTFLPDYTRNYTLFNNELVDKIVAKKEEAIPPLMSFLGVVQDERQITEGLYILDKMAGSGVKGLWNTYPVIARFNHTNSPNVQVGLAGVYRKTQVPDGFGPLMSMMIKNTFYPPQSPFDPNEEVGGAILEYLRNKSAAQVYQN